MHLINTVVIFLVTVFQVKGSCPEWPSGSPCFCVGTKEGIYVDCSGPSTESDVFSALNEVRTTNPWELHLENLQLEELPLTVRSVSSLRLTNCDIGRLQRNTSTLWPSLSEIEFESVRIRSSPWSQLKGAHVLKSVKVSNIFSAFASYGSDLRFLPPSVEYLDFRKTGTTKFQKASMAHLKNLIYVFIADMPLNEFSRDVLPPDMSQLHTFILGNTLIKELETDFFRGMPKLEVLMLNGNRFSSLDSQLFMPLRNHLTHLVAERNPLMCNCSLIWLKKNFQSPRKIKVLATCYNEESNQFKEVMKLDEDEIC